MWQPYDLLSRKFRGNFFFKKISRNFPQIRRSIIESITEKTSSSYYESQASYGDPCRPHTMVLADLPPWSFLPFSCLDRTSYAEKIRGKFFSKKISRDFLIIRHHDIINKFYCYIVFHTPSTWINKYLD
jgi:hypothetical protein